jgi:hypothetical protein
VAFIRTEILGINYRLHHQGEVNQRTRTVPADVILSSPILFTLTMEAIRFSESSFLQNSQGVTSQRTTFFKLFINKLTVNYPGTDVSMRKD